MACSLGETEKISKEAFLYCKPRRHTEFLNRHHENGYLGNAIAKREREGGKCRSPVGHSVL